MKGVFVILDGIGDEPCKALGGKTPLEAANTPNLDALARKSKLDYCYTVKEGVAPESSNAVISLLGYDPNGISRGRLEVMGQGIKLKQGDLAFRTNFATVDGLEGKNVLDRRAGRTLPTKDARELAKAIKQEVKLPYKFEFYPTLHHRGVLIFRGGFSDNITNIDQGYGHGVVKSGNSGKLVDAKPMDDEEDSKLAADLVNMFVRHSHAVLDKHPINVQRAKKGLYAANVLLCRDGGSENIRLKKVKGKWMALGYMGLEKGIAKAAGMDVYSFKYPKLKGIDVYGSLHLGLSKAIKNSIKMLKRNNKKYDYFYVHFKETDTPGHDNKPLDKVKMIEDLDKNFFGFLRKFIKNNKLVITGDHTTSCRKKSHTEGPVPVLSYPFTGKGKPPEGQRFTESWGLKGKKILGRKLLDLTLFSKK